MSSLKALSSSTTSKVVTIAFYNPVWVKKKRKYIASGDPVLELEVLGDKHNLEQVGEQLFRHYLGAIRHESLHSHIWRFEVDLEEADEETVALDTNIPILSEKMMAREPYPLGYVDPIPCKVTKGLELLFFYDEGNSTRMFCSIDNIVDLPSDESPSSFPRVKGEVEEKEAVADTGATSSSSSSSNKKEEDLTIEDYFPLLAEVVMSPEFGKSFFGPADKDLHGAVEGGPHQNGDQIFCPLQFMNFEEYLITADRAAHELLSPDPDIREGWTNIIIFPPEDQGDKKEKMIEETKTHFERIERYSKMSGGSLTYQYPENDRPTENEIFEMCGPSMRTLRLTPEEMGAARKELHDRGFNFAEKYPQISKMFSPSNKKKDYFTIHNKKLSVCRGILKATSERIPQRTICQEKISTFHGTFDRVEDIYGQDL